METAFFIATSSDKVLKKEDMQILELKIALSDSNQCRRKQHLKENQKFVLSFHFIAFLLDNFPPNLT